MSDTIDIGIQQVLVTGATLLAVACSLNLLLRWLRRVTPGLSIGIPVTTALTLRIGAAVVIGLVGVEELRGVDEIKFVVQAQETSEAALLSSPWLEAMTQNLHRFVIATQLHVFDSPDLALRIAHIGIAVAGIALLAAAVSELASPRAGFVAGWLLALEPTSIFYSGILHKEANLFLAVGLVALGGAKLWHGAGRAWLIAILLGLAVAVSTRYYVGVVLIAAAGLIVLHAWVRNRRPGDARRLAVAGSALVLVFVALPSVFWLTTSENLARLDRLQRTTATSPANLPLEPVDFSSREGVAIGLPRRVRDVLLRPYPWQLGSTKQRVGLFGTVFVFALLAWLAVELVRNRRRIMEWAGPLVYIGFMVLIAYSLSAANAGTAFRHRTQLVSIGLCLSVVLLERHFASSRASSDLEPAGPRTPTAAGPQVLPPGEPAPAR